MTADGFIALDPLGVAGLFLVGFIGGMVSGFIGSGGAFVLTPAMMSMGVPGIVAVASNICHKFPKALVGAIKRAKFGQVDVKLGLIMGVSAEAGMLFGASIQQRIKEAFGDAGSNLYISAVFVVVLAIVGGFVLRDAWRLHKAGAANQKETAGRLALWVRSINIPGTMVYFKSIDAKVSFLITIPMGFATGLLAATIAVGGFIGVPSMIYVLGVPSLMASATELVIAFVMGLGGTIKFGLEGFVDIRLAMILLAGSLFGIQIGAICTTYVRPYMVKVVMGVIMVLVLVSRLFVVPVYMADLAIIPTLGAAGPILRSISFWIMVAALATGAAIIARALWTGMREHAREVAAAKAATPAAPAE
ncbi:MAG: sulfite exporter TauE/SafE family protein [Alphaproteobacteria bacterium]|nr:sulfite exporter TauE/SafE family protein [Alphaproteobacteria bacterium]